MKKSTLAESVVKLAICEAKSMPEVEPVVLPINVQIEISMDIFISLDQPTHLEKGNEAFIASEIIDNE